MSRSPQPVNSEQLVEEREALNAMLQSDGWRFFTNRVMTEFQGAGYWARMGQAVTKGELEPKILHATSLEMLNMLSWPAARIRQLKGHTE